LGRPIANREEYREVVLQVLGGTYVLQYRYDGSAILMLRVFHGRESPDDDNALLPGGDARPRNVLLTAARSPSS
jgi:hypothetical protein